jgi:hypothetical protein
MTKQEHYDRGYAHGRANRRYNRNLGFKAGRRKRRTKPRGRVPRLQRWLRWTGNIFLFVVAHLARAVMAN